MTSSVDAAPYDREVDEGDAPPPPPPLRGRGPGRSDRRWVRPVAWGLVALVVVVTVFSAVTFVQVWRASEADQARPVDAIVVLGAAQYDGRPSPVLEARLLHALDLWERGLADVVVTTGANQPGDRFTQGFAGYTYLREAGVPEEAILVVTDGTSTYEELSATANVLRERGMDRVLLVSDPYHSLRARAVASEVGLDAYVSPADTGAPVGRLAKETVAVVVGRLIGFRRLASLT